MSTGQWDLLIVVVFILGCFALTVAAGRLQPKEDSVNTLPEGKSSPKYSRDFRFGIDCHIYFETATSPVFRCVCSDVYDLEEGQTVWISETDLIGDQLQPYEIVTLQKTDFLTLPAHYTLRVYPAKD